MTKEQMKNRILNLEIRMTKLEEKVKELESSANKGRVNKPGSAYDLSKRPDLKRKKQKSPYSLS